MPESTCAHCKRTFRSQRGRSHCSKRCANQAYFAAHRERIYAYREVNGRYRWDRTCKVCQQPFTTISPKAKYCSTGPGSCESTAKTGINLQTGEPAKPRKPTFLESPTLSNRDTARYKRALRADPCAICGHEGGALDHIEPRNGTNNDWTNLTGACQRCNGIKHTLPLLLALLWVPTARQYHDMRRTLYPGRVG